LPLIQSTHTFRSVKFKFGSISFFTNLSDGRAPSHTQPHNEEDDDLEVVYGFICKYGSNWAFVYFGRPNQEDKYRMKACINISKKTSNSSKHKLELWSEEHKKINFFLLSHRIHYY